MTAGFDAGDQPDTGAVERAALTDSERDRIREAIECQPHHKQVAFVLMEVEDILTARNLLAQPADTEAVGLRARLAAVEALADDLDREAKAASAAIEDGETPFEIWSAQETAKALRRVRTRLRAVLADTEPPASGNADAGATDRPGREAATAPLAGPPVLADTEDRPGGGMGES